MEKGKRAVAFLLSALQPPVTYPAVALAAYSLSSVSTASLLLVAALPPLLWCCSRQRRRLCGSTPAYASLVGHFGSALLTFTVKLLPLASAGLIVTFFVSSCAFGLVLTRMIMSDPGRVDDSCLERHREGQTIADYPKSNKSYESDLWGRRHSNLDAYDNFWRGKYCYYCHSFVERYDHHCAAVQNCIGLKNSGLFILLLITSCITEMLFLAFCSYYLKDVIVAAARKDDVEMSFKNLVYMAWELYGRLVSQNYGRNETRRSEEGLFTDTRSIGRKFQDSINKQLHYQGCLISLRPL